MEFCIFFIIKGVFTIKITVSNSCMIKIPDGDRTDEVVDQDGIIAEIPLYASKQIAYRLNDALAISMRPDRSRIFDLETVNSALKSLVDENSKPILLAMVQSDYNL